MYIKNCGQVGARYHLPRSASLDIRYAFRCYWICAARVAGTFRKLDGG
jgi:hypothetical protein